MITQWKTLHISRLLYSNLFVSPPLHLANSLQKRQLYTEKKCLHGKSAITAFVKLKWAQTYLILQKLCIPWHPSRRFTIRNKWHIILVPKWSIALLYNYPLICENTYMYNVILFTSWFGLISNITLIRSIIKSYLQHVHTSGFTFRDLRGHRQKRGKALKKGGKQRKFGAWGKKAKYGLKIKENAQILATKKEEIRWKEARGELTYLVERGCAALMGRFFYKTSLNMGPVFYPKNP